MINRVVDFKYCLSFERVLWLKLTRFICLFVLFLFRQNVSAQSVIDSIKIDPQNLQLNLFYTDSNQYKFQVQENVQDSFLKSDSTFAILTMDSAVKVIQTSIENLKQNQKIAFNYVVLYVLNMNFKMEEMRVLFEKLSELGIRVKVEFPSKKWFEIINFNNIFV